MQGPPVGAGRQRAVDVQRSPVARRHAGALRPMQRSSAAAVADTRSTRRGPSVGPADGSHLAAASASAKELVAAIRFKPRYGDTARHLDLLQHFSGLRIDAPQITLVGFQGTVPQLVIDPGDAGDEAVGFDG